MGEQVRLIKSSNGSSPSKVGRLKKNNGAIFSCGKENVIKANDNNYLVQ